MTFHRTQLIGNLGDDPELRYGQSGTARATFRVAVNDRWKDSSGQQQEHAEWYRVVTWGRLAELCGEHLQKGNRVFVEGKLRTRSWQDDSGQTRYMTELHAETVEFLDGRRPDPEA
jgi:single-strand DNA-binding protein